MPVQPIVDDACAAVVVDVVVSLQPACGVLSGSSVYLGGGAVAFNAAPGIAFSQAGDVAPFSMFNTIRTSPMNPTAGEWGTAMVRIQPDETSSDDYARMIMVGDVTLHKETADGSHLILQTSDTPLACPGAPNSAIIQTPPGITMSLTINGVDLALMNATAVIYATPNGEMRVIMLHGTALVTAEGVSQTVTIGQMTTIPLGGDDGFTPVGPPMPPVPLDPVLIQYIPFYICVDIDAFFNIIDIPAGQRWTSTDIPLEAGQSFILVASGLVKTIDYMPWSSPQGHPPADCIAVGRTDWGDCKCRTMPEWGTCTMDETATMVLVARVGEGQPFIVRSGGVFTAPNDGVLQLGPNDNFFTDNVGAFHAIVLAIDMN